MVRNKSFAPPQILVSLVHLMYNFVFFNQCFQMLVYMEKGDNTVMNSGIFTFSPQNTEASVDPKVKLQFLYIYMHRYPVYNNL